MFISILWRLYCSLNCYTSVRICSGMYPLYNIVGCGLHIRVIMCAIMSAIAPAFSENNPEEYTPHFAIILIHNTAPCRPNAAANEWKNKYLKILSFPFCLSLIASSLLFFSFCSFVYISFEIVTLILFILGLFYFQLYLFWDHFTFCFAFVDLLFTANCILSYFNRTYQGIILNS